jgi:hypothetical protein
MAKLLDVFLQIENIKIHNLNKIKVLLKKLVLGFVVKKKS